MTIAGFPIFPYLPKYINDKVEKPNLEIYATNWGFKGTMNEFCQKAKEAGYFGVEVWTPQKGEKTEELLQALETHDLHLALLAGNWGDTYQDHLNIFQSSIDHAISLKPRFINCHAGKDYFTPLQNDNFLEYSFEKTRESGIPIYHETHRGRILYSATVAEHYIDHFEDLELTLDISHWCCVHESLLADQKDRIDKVLKRVSHIHSRVGFAEAPQIPDPNDEQFAQAVQAHFAWWDEVVRLKASKGETLTMTTEFGPPPYMWTHLKTGQPLEDNWLVNVEMKNLWEKRYLKKA